MRAKKAFCILLLNARKNIGGHVSDDLANMAGRVI